MSAERVIFINLLLYFIGFVVLLYKRNQLSEQSVGLLSIVINGVGVLFSMGIRLSDITNDNITIKWFSFGNTSFTIDILLNDLTFLMYFVVQFIALWVQVFSLKYMSADKGFGRYAAYLNLFIFSMVGLVISGNLLMIYFFWELVGLCSYLLIGFWYRKYSASNAAKKAFIVNRIGDIALFIGIILIYRYFGSFNFNTIIEKISLLPTINTPILTTIGLLVFVGCLAKSAQFPLHIWLPDAMEGPTPVSALIHAATMVAAGIFLLARLHPIFSADVHFVMVIIGTITMFLGALSALVQYDIKKLLAYSTISQLGLMVLGIGVGAVGASLFHLITHAFFKAGLFLCAGAVIYYLHHEQDMRKMGGLRKIIPVIYYAHAICAASLAGLPLFSGFLSKDAIIVGVFEWAGKQANQWFLIIPAIALISAGFSAYYMMRQVFMIYFLRNENPFQIMSEGAISIYKNVSKTIENIVNVEDDEVETDEQAVTEVEVFSITSFDKIGVMEWSVIIMAISSIGFVFSANPFSFEKSWFFNLFPYHPKSYEWIGWVSVLVSVNGLLLGYILTKEEVSQLNINQKEPNGQFARFLFNNYYLNQLYHKIFVYPLVGFSKNKAGKRYESNQKGIANKIAYFDKNIFDSTIDKLALVWLKIAKGFTVFEKNVVDYAVNTFAEKVGEAGKYTRQIQGGSLQKYIISVFIGLIALLLLIISLQ